MLCYLSILGLLLGVSSGNYLDKNLDSWQTNFTNNVEEFLRGNESDISSMCKEHLSQYIQALRSGKQWAVKMFDARAKLVPSGVLDGNVVDLGSFDECLNIQHITSDSTIRGKYCLGKISINIKLQSIQANTKLVPETFVIRAPRPRVVPTSEKFDLQLAKCFPDSCSAADIQKMYENYDFEMAFDDSLCQTKADQPKLDAGGVATISVYGVILWLVVASTAYDVVLYYLEKKPRHSLLVAFSALTNGRKLIATTNNPNDISCLHGIRVISTMWIILDHGYSIHFMFPIRNSFYHTEWINDAANMFMLSATLAVDTFFLLAGLLISYLFMNGTTKGAKFNILVHYIHRYLRLTPVLVVIMVFHITLLGLVGSGPFWPTVIQQQLIDGCQIHWWKTLLYIQNIFGRGKAMCVPHSWYLSVDMQLFFLSPFLLLPLRRFHKMALSVTGSLAIMSIIACFLIGWFFELNAYMQGNHTFDKEMDFVWLYYFPPHTRAAPWLIGIILGYLIFETKQGRVKLTSKAAIGILWLVSLTVLCTCVFVGHGLIVGEYNRLANSFHIALVRPVWALAIAWVIFACVSGFGGPVNWFLSLPVFQVVSKLTYCLYLVHYTMIYVVTAQMRTVPMFDNSEAMYRFWGDFTFTFVVSLVLSLAVEFPVAAIDKYLFGGGDRKVK